LCAVVLASLRIKTIRYFYLETLGAKYGPKEDCNEIFYFFRRVLHFKVVVFDGKCDKEM